MTRLRHERFSVLKGMLLFYLLLLLLFFAVTPFLSMLLYWETDFSRSVLPVLIGFCLNGIFLVLVFAIYQFDATMKTRQNNKLLLRGLLTPMLRRTLAQEHAPHTTSDALPGPGRLLQAKELLRTHPLAQEDMERLHQLFARTAFTLESMTSVAVQIDPPHMQAWIAITAILQSMEELSDPEAYREALLQLMDRIQWFDELPL